MTLVAISHPKMRLSLGDIFKKMKNKKIIAISGYARTGKDTLCNLLIEHFKEFGIKAERFSFADELKNDLSPYLQSEYGVDIFSLSGAEKELFRPLMLWKGYYHRVKTQGTYFHEILNKKISESDCDIAIITDLRYAEYENDEADFVKNKGGFIISLRRYESHSENYRIFAQPANSDEEKNQKVIDENYSNLALDWSTILDSDGLVRKDKQLIVSSVLNSIHVQFNSFLKGKSRKGIRYDI